MRRTCLVVAVLAAGWTLVALATGGASLHWGPVHVSSRNPRNPALLALVALITAWALAPRAQRRSTLAADLLWLRDVTTHAALWLWRTWSRTTAWLATDLPRWLAPAIVGATAATLLVTSWRETAFVAGESDSWGYVSHAHLWATGTLRVPQPLMAELSSGIPRDALAPLAYRPATDGAAIVPVTSPGLPMVMALFELAGGAGAVFAVVPLMAALVIVVTYLLGRDTYGRWTGASAAVLLAASPAFLFQLTAAPMSDIPAACWWTLSLWLALQPGRGGVFLAGLAAGAAILTRANLAPLAIVAAALTLATQRSDRWRAAWFAAGAVPACVLIALLFTYWYGSPLDSGYGSVGQIYALSNLWPNLQRYPVWLLASQSPLVLLALAAPLLPPRRVGAALWFFVIGTLSAYVLYLPFDAWWYLRFLLPAFPALLVLVSATLVAMGRWLPVQARVPVVAAVLAATVWHGVTYAAARATFDTGGAQKYPETGRWVARHLPRNAAILSGQHSGSLRYYSGRTTIRFVWIPADHLAWTVDTIRGAGFDPYLVVEDWEDDVVRRQFPSAASTLHDPIATLPLGNVRVYHLGR